MVGAGGWSSEEICGSTERVRDTKARLQSATNNGSSKCEVRGEERRGEERRGEEGEGSM